MKKIFLIGFLFLSGSAFASSYDTFTSTKFGTFVAGCSGYFATASTWTYQVAIATSANLNTCRTNTDVWTQLEPSEEVFNWTTLDQEVAISTHAGQSFMITLPIYNQRWSQSGCADTHCPHTVMLQYYQFVKRMVQHYKNVVTVWEIWNEPNINWNGADVANFTTDPKAYFDILKTASRAIREVDPTSTILLAATAFPESQSAYMNALMALGAGSYFDKYNIHTYSANPNSGIDNALSNITTIMNTYGQVKPIWVTEMSIVGSRFTDVIPSETEASKANYLTKSFAVLLSTHNVERIIWHTLRDCGTEVGQATNFNFGMYDFNVSTHPAANAWKAFQARLLGYTAQDPFLTTSFSNYYFKKTGANDRYVLWANTGTVTGASPGAYTSVAVTDMFNVTTTTYSAAAFPSVSFSSSTPVFLEGIP